MNWWQYLLLVNIYLVLFYGFYTLLLRKETFFQLNRVYLVSAALLSFFIPMIQADWVKNLFITQKVEYTIYGGSAVNLYQFKPVESAPVSIGQVLAYIYLAGVAFLALRMVWQLIVLNKIIKQPKHASPYSFFKKIRIDDTANNSDIIAAHEQVHAKQWHSVDVLLIETLMILNWFNPVVYFYRRAIKHIHEFIADSHVLQNEMNKADYALLLLSQTFNTPSHGLVNHFFNHSLLKQRIVMLQKNRSQRIKLIKYGLSAPLFMLMLILTSATVNNSKPIDSLNKKAEKLFSLPVTSKIIAMNDVAIGHLSDKHFKVEKVASIPVDQLHSAEQPATTADNTDTTPKVSNQVFAAVEQQPTFPGGIEKFYTFLRREINYPAVAREEGIEGKALVTFIIEKDGSVSNVQAVRAPSKSIKQEAERCISASPKWNPGYQNGKPVRVKYVVPISFNLAKDDNKPAAGKITDSDITKPEHGLDEIHVVGYASPTDNDGFFSGHKVLPNGDTVKFAKLYHNMATTKRTGDDASKLFIQGTSSFSDLNPPLILVDGKETTYTDLQKLDVNSVGSIAILKDKSSTDKYGAKGKNGVLIVTMRKDTPAKTPGQKSN